MGIGVKEATGRFWSGPVIESCFYKPHSIEDGKEGDETPNENLILAFGSGVMFSFCIFS